KIVKRKWTKWKAGVAIAIIVVFGLLAHSAAFHSEYVKAINDGESEGDASKIAKDVGGRNYSICAACGLLRFMKHWVFTGKGLFEWSGLMMMGLIIGAFISAQFAGEFALRVPEGKIILQVALGGFLMGIGAVTGLGCTVGHILSGTPALALSSLLAWVSIAAGIWITTYMLFMRD
ncbi:MAG: YeeE/YedE family protein, partial [Candidatus Altiarchaeales archaeon]|nr:YeeE/YedE family protein [Candidatus Altiarchaeales archaeon]